MVHRGLTERPFTALERRRLAEIEPFLAHLLTNSNNDSSFPVIDSEQSGLIIATGDGRTVHASPNGRRLLFLATHPNLVLETNVHWLPSLPPALVRICRNLTFVFAGDPVAGAPGHYHRNIWGGFSFRAHPLEGEANADGLIGIVVTYREPLLVAIMRQMQTLRLTGRQAEVCRLLVSGSSYAEIAKELGISRHTAIAHARWIYDKLDVHNRSELINRLVSALH
jgi:DNA-binding CsgD family transcriptional regulator